MKVRYKAIIAYCGYNYHGWAKQPKLQTIQGVVENAFEKVFNQHVDVFAAGRTDAGVNASGQVIHFDLKIKVESKQIKQALNKNLPYDIRITKVSKTSNTFNARFSAKSKLYTYMINTNKTYNPIDSYHTYQYNKPININRMKQSSKLFLGFHNFLSFSTDERQGQGLERKIISIAINECNKIVSILIKGTGFLRSQVRMMVGTLLALNEKKITLSDIKFLLANPKKGQAIYKAPACGLCLTKVNY